MTYILAGAAISFLIIMLIRFATKHFAVQVKKYLLEFYLAELRKSWEENPMSASSTEELIQLGQDQLWINSEHIVDTLYSNLEAKSRTSLLGALLAIHRMAITMVIATRDIKDFGDKYVVPKESIGDSQKSPRLNSSNPE